MVSGGNAKDGLYLSEVKQRGISVLFGKCCKLIHGEEMVTNKF